LNPDFVSITYGAGGSTRQKTVELAGRIQSELSLRCMAHLTCVSHTSAEITAILDQLRAQGIGNVLALRGDPPQGQAVFTPSEGGFAHASELIQFIEKNYPDFCLGVAGHPEGHPQCLNLTRDAENLKRKIEAGGKFIVTQLFFDNSDFYRFRDRIRAAGINVPIVAGIMPILNVAQIKRVVTMCGARIPNHYLNQLEKYESDPSALYQLGLNYAIRQCQDLLQFDIDGLHFYTMNKSRATVDIVKQLNLPQR
jgi:methylenetetrahydrofolate reductase (NADPH)